LPQEIFDRPKHGFNPPIDYWIKNSWRRLLDDALAHDSALWRIGIVDKKSVHGFMQALDDDMRLGSVGFCFITLNKWLLGLERKGYILYA